ncbi:hypothetical protein JDV02_004002 [Purpureocillium takamizusanense]|uniref:Uncharacterized protein n=1 Tax=Purpureocillium takamizusanense TaxID=2060973 RepID=A0A9Q8VAC8_9HYPO|nr:uncharacterized protein JDV02_004002 [Purpureocillium takamizusanense]UNI17676.1 hypothetical protein JDV02_004002 [Purpureocillium takamizusanense]
MKVNLMRYCSDSTTAVRHVSPSARGSQFLETYGISGDQEPFQSLGVEAGNAEGPNEVLAWLIEEGRSLSWVVAASTTAKSLVGMANSTRHMRTSGSSVATQLSHLQAAITPSRRGRLS